MNKTVWTEEKRNLKPEIDFSSTPPTISIDIEHREGLLEVGNFLFRQVSVGHGFSCFLKSNE
jgi:hypothetical protein